MAKLASDHVDFKRPPVLDATHITHVNFICVAQHSHVLLLQWRHARVTASQTKGNLFRSFIGLTSTTISKHSPVTGGLPTQRASNAECVSWRPRASRFKLYFDALTYKHVFFHCITVAVISHERNVASQSPAFRSFFQQPLFFFIFLCWKQRNIKVHIYRPLLRGVHMRVPLTKIRNAQSIF